MHLLRRNLDLLLPIIAGGLLVALPQIDLTVAGWFYDPFDGFFLKDHPLARFVFDLVPWVSRTVLLGLVVFLLLAWTWRRGHPFFVAHRKAMAYLLLVALAGPLLLVNTVFKDHWGRARPSQIEQFGGDKQFTRAAVPADQCVKNCSFVSGHASTGFFFLAPAFVYPRRRRLWLAAGAAAGLGTGLVRIVQGGHFVSDVVFSGIVVYLTARVLHALMYREFAKSVPDPGRSG
jgi:lipid A 4'-phosphatase